MLVSLTRRFVALFCALWTAVALAEPFQHHECSVHDRLPASPVESHAHHGGTDQPDNDQSESACHCLGACTSAPALAAAVGLSLEVSTIQLAVSAPQHESAAFVRPGFLLPYALAPPTHLI
jgi:hypothetical protein